MQDTATLWDLLHQSPRFRPVYPSDHVVRFMMASRHLLEKSRWVRFLDIGMGAGRHATARSGFSLRSFWD